METDRVLILDQKVDDMTQAPPLMGTEPAEHPVLTLPFSAEIDGRTYRGEGLSLTRAEIAGLIDPQMEGAARLAKLQFDFDGFTIALTVDCLVQAIAPGGGGRATLVFRDPTGGHLPQLRHMLNSYIAGDVVSLGQTLGVATAQRAGSGKPKASAGGGFLIRRLVGGMALLALTAVLAVSVARIAYARIYALQVPGAAQVVAKGQMLAAVSAGQIEYVNLDAAKGEVAFTLSSIGGQSISIAMPCDCDAQLLIAGVGETVLAGAPVMALSATDAPLMLDATVEREYLFELAAADHVTARFADGTIVRAHLAGDNPGPLAGMAGQQTVQVRLMAEDPLPAERAGQLARLTIVRPAPAGLGPIINFMDRI